MISIEKIKSRFIKRTNIIDDNFSCWEWNGFKNRDGYGFCTFRNQGHNASRVAWLLFKGEIPENLCVLHKCDNRACVRLDHLFLGTRKDNQQDMWLKGRANNTKPPLKRGSENGNAKINEYIVKTLKAIHKFNPEIPILRIAKAYKLPYYIVWDFLGRNKTWKHITV